MKNKIILLVIGSIMMLSQCLIAANTWYVSPDGNDTNSGATWALAKKSIQAGVDVASNGDTVLVTNGNYILTNQVTVSIGITVKSVNGADLTVVNGNYPVTTNRCFSLSDTNAILDGFTITNGYGNTSYMEPSADGGGVYNAGTVQNCTISGNTAEIGGGIYNHGTVENCTILGNTGGGVKNEGIVENCTISGNNTAPDSTGGVFSWGGAIGRHGCTVKNCTISGNTGNGVYNYGDTVEDCTISENNGSGVGMTGGGMVKNCTISGNTGGGVGNDISTIRNCIISGNAGLGVYNNGTVENCTIAGNTGLGVQNQDIVRNCIVYYNGNGDVLDEGSMFSGTFYSCAPGLSGNGNITDDPQFVDSAGGNYRLQATSPCINTGTNQDWMTNAVDLDGNSRIINGRVDMGAYEYTHSAVIGPVIKANGQTNNVTINHSSNLSITIQINPSQYSGINADWWVVALANGSWYYFNSAVQWTTFDGVLANCHPVNQGALFNLSPTEILNITGVGFGSYTFWFAVSQMDGVLDINEPMLVDSVNVIVQ